MALRIDIICEVGPNRDHPEKLKGYVLSVADTGTGIDRQMYVLYRERIISGKTELRFDLDAARYLDPAATDDVMSQRGKTMAYNDLGPFVSNEGIDN